MFMLDDLGIDRILSGVATTTNDDQVLYRLSQLSDATIETTSETKDITDAQGTIIKRFYRAKQGTLNANNAMLNLSILGAQSGSGKQLATDANVIVMPAIKVFAKPNGENSPVTLPGGDVVEGSVIVTRIANNGTLAQDIMADGTVAAKKYTASPTTAGADTFMITGNQLTLPTDEDATQFEVVYKRKVKSGVAIVNKADAFPGTVHLILKALAVDPCEASKLRGVYIDIPSFQVSPDVNIQIGGTDTQQLAYNGNLQVDYCSSDKALYRIYVAEDDVEQVG